MANLGLSVPSPLVNTNRSTLTPKPQQDGNLCGGRSAPGAAPLRRSAEYQPTLWHDSFIQTLSTEYATEANMAKLEELKSHVRHLISQTSEVAAELELLDVLSRLGVAYHFERETDLMLQGMSTNIEDVLRELDGDLLHTALLFRLLREHGLNVPQDVFDSFKDEQGSFRASLRDDPEGMLSLYEASFLAFEGEKDLEEARAFASAALKELITLNRHAEAELSERVEYTLEMPLRWRVPRVHSRWFIDMCGRWGKVSPLLLDFAKLDFNVLQSVHREGLKAASRWWKELGLQNMSFFRDRLVENFWAAIEMAFEPQFIHARYDLTKVCSLITTIDDVYDVYGTIDELEILTDAVERWDVGAIDKLPNEMKLCFHALLNSVSEIALDCYEKNGFNCLSYLKNIWTNLCKAYLTEARWYHSNYTPTLEEYLDNAWISISGPVILTHAYFLLTENFIKEGVDNIEELQDLIKWPSMITRLCNDLATSVSELERGDVPKSIQCYMREKNVSEAMAREYIKTLINDAWMKLNKEYSNNKLVSKSFMKAAINMGRVNQVVYQHGDGYGDPSKETKHDVKLLLIEPIY